AFATAHRLPEAPIRRGLFAHMLGDEAFAIEQSSDTRKSVFVVRMTIYGVWVLSTVVGALFASLIPPNLLGAGVKLGFPAIVVLRVLPGFGRLRPSKVVRDRIDRVLPMAVFLNFAVYISWTEVRTAPVAAVAAIFVVGVATLSSRAGLVLSTCAGTLVYAAVQ